MVEEASSILNPDTNPHASRTKRRKIGPGSAARSQAEPPSCRTRWRTEAEQQIYSSKLVDALCHLRRPDSSGATVRDAADRVLAVSAKGRTRWSRAIMSRRLSLRLSQIRKKHRRAAARPDSGLKKAAAGRKKLPPLQRKVRVLSRLIPGCHKISLPNLLEETTDYIAALEMQAKAMTFLTGLLNGGAVHSGGGGGGGGGGGSLDNSDQ